MGVMFLNARKGVTNMERGNYNNPCDIGLEMSRISINYYITCLLLL